MKGAATRERMVWLNGGQSSKIDVLSRKNAQGAGKRASSSRKSQGWGEERRLFKLSVREGRLEWGHNQKKRTKGSGV